MKHLFTTTALLFSMTAFAQVGINNTSPKATLDITAKTSGTKPEGLIIPQLTGDQIRIATTATPTPVYGTAQKGLIVYASTADSAPAGATASITAPGYYYFDGSAWQKIATGNTLNTSLASGNIYVGNSSNVATAVMPTGDVAISNTGATSIGAGKVTTTHLANNAVTVAKLPTGATATTFLRGDGTWVTPTDTNTTYTGSTSINLNGTSFERTALTGDVTASANSNATSVVGIQGRSVSNTAPTSGQVLGWNGTNWAPATDATGVSTTLSSGKIYVGNASNVATAVTPTGDVTIDNAGVTSIGTGKVTNSQLSAVSTGTGGIYKGSGSLAGNTTVAQNANTLDFTSTATTGTSHFTVDGTTLNVDAVNNRVGIGTATPQKILHVNANNNSIRFENLPSLSGGTTSTGLVVDANGDIYKNNTISTEGQIFRIGMNGVTYNAGSESALRFNLNDDATEMDIASNGASNFINTINGCTITENVTLTAGFGTPSRTTDRIILQPGVYKVQVRIVGIFAAQNNGNTLTIKAIVGNNEYSLISFSNSSNAFGTGYFDDYILIDTAQSIDFTVTPLNNNFTVASTGSPGIGKSQRSLIMIQRLR